MKKAFLILVCFFGFVQYAHADIIINEIAWMGTTTNSADEWIELHNTGSESVDLSGWIISSTSSSFSITLPSGTITGSGFYLLERTDDASVPGVTADHTYTGALSNNGESLVLKNAGGSIVDTVPFSDGWTAGDNTTKETMQRSGASWITAPATPRASNSSSSSDTTSETPVVVSSGGSIAPAPQKPAEVAHITLKTSLPEQVFAGIAEKFSIDVIGYSKEVIHYGEFVWNFGDGTRIVQQRPSPIMHTYEHEGEYVLVFEYYQNYYTEKPVISYRQIISVTPATLAITNTFPNGAVEITNQSTYEIDAKSWVIRAGEKSFTIPHQTILLSGKKVALSSTATGFSSMDTSRVILSNPSGELISEYPVPVLIPEPRPVLQKVRTSTSSLSTVQPSVTLANFPESESLTTEPPENLQDLQGASIIGADSSSLRSRSLPFLFGLLVLGSAMLGMYFYTRTIKKPLVDEQEDLDVEIHEIK